MPILRTRPAAPAKPSHNRWLRFIPGRCDRRRRFRHCPNAAVDHGRCADHFASSMWARRYYGPAASAVPPVIR
jgi:hypothetical protein